MLFYLKPDMQRAYVAKMLDMHPDPNNWDSELIDRVIRHVSDAADRAMYDACNKILISRRYA